MKQKSISCFTALLMTLSLLPASMGALTVNAADQQQTGTKDGYDWELWNQFGQGSVSMQTGSSGAFSCSWSNIENCLFRSGKKLGSTKNWSDYGGIQIDYNVDYKPDGNSYMCIYGWTEDPTVEYYIVEAWGTWRPPGQQGGKGTVSSDGKSYDIFTSTRYNQPSIHGTETFEQYWSVNKTNPATAYQEKNLQGTITVSNHFAQWEKSGMKMGKMYEVALNIEGYQSNGSANVKKNTLKMDVPIDDTDNDDNNNGSSSASSLETSKVSGTSSSLSDNFEKQTSLWEARGGSTGIYKYDDGYALAATGRTNYWNGFQGALSGSGSYTFEADLFANEATTFTVGVQYDEGGSTTYDNAKSVSGSAGKWTSVSTTLSVPSGADNIYIYVQAGEDGDTSLCDFAMDNVKVGGTGSGSSSGSDSSSDTPLFGDVNLDGEVDLTDLTTLSIYLMGGKKLDSEALANADVQYDEIVDISDLATLKQYISKDDRVVLGKGYKPKEKEKDTTKDSETPKSDEVVKINNKVVNGVLTSTCDTSWIPAGSKVTAISFDDGPFGGNQNPGRIHNALKKSGFHATFFYWGEHISSGQQEIKDAYNAGFEVANHTWTHPYLTQQGDHGASEVKKTRDALNQLLGVENDYSVRAPYLSIDQGVLSACGVPFPNCGIDTQDWNNASKDSIVNTIKSNMGSGNLANKVVLCHENYDTTAGAMEEVFPYMKSNGWVNAAVIEMFKYNNKEMRCGTKYDGC